MRLIICCFLFLGISVWAEQRVKRQSTYTFPGPRSDRRYRPQMSAAPVFVEERDDEEVYPRRQYQAQPAQPQYAPAQPRAPAPSAAAPPAPPPVYETPRQVAPAPRAQSAPARRRASSSAASNRANKYGSAPQQSLSGREEDEDEEEQGPDPLTLLLQDSQFSCGGKQDGYYADDSVNCQVFHYCVGGAKHSWMCPENTVFHQVHLNCVPDAQDICSQSQKFHFVNDYLYKPVDYEGPNKTARYSQRYYPEGYVVGDPIIAPQEHAPRRPAAPQPQSYPQQAPAPRPQARQVVQQAPPPQQQPAYRAPTQPQSAAYAPPAQSRPASRPSRPVESYPAEVPQSYRAAVATRQAPQPQVYPREPQQQAVPPQHAYRVATLQQAPRETYRVVAPQQPVSSPQGAYVSSEENHYQPQAPRRPHVSEEDTSPQRTAYANPRQQYRAQSRSSAGYSPYAPQPSSGVQYDEDY